MPTLELAAPEAQETSKGPVPDAPEAVVTPEAESETQTVEINTESVTEEDTRIPIDAKLSFIALFDLHVEVEGDFDRNRKFLHARNALQEILDAHAFPLRPFAFKNFNRPRPDDSWAMHLDLQKWQMDAEGFTHFCVQASVTCGDKTVDLGTFTASSEAAGDPEGKPMYQLETYRQPARVAFEELYQAFEAQYVVVGEPGEELFERGKPFRARKKSIF